MKTEIKIKTEIDTTFFQFEILGHNDKTFLRMEQEIGATPSDGG